MDLNSLLIFESNVNSFSLPSTLIQSNISIVFLAQHTNNSSHPFENNRNKTESRVGLIEPQWNHPLLGLFLLTVTLITIFGNTLVIFAVIRERYLKSVTNYYIVSLAVADLIVGLLVMPFNSLNKMTNDFWFFGNLWCDIWHSIDVFASTASINSLLIIALDRHSAISDPISYHTRLLTRYWLLFVALIWICSACISFPAIAYWRWITNEYFLNQCVFPDDIYYLIFSSLVSFYIPLFIMIFVYIRIYRAATRQMNALKSGQKLNCKSADGTPLTLRIHHGGYHRVDTTTNESVQNSKTNNLNKTNSSNNIYKQDKANRTNDDKQIDLNSNLAQNSNNPKQQKKSARVLVLDKSNICANKYSNSVECLLNFPFSNTIDFIKSQMKRSSSCNAKISLELIRLNNDTKTPQLPLSNSSNLNQQFLITNTSNKLDQDTKTRDSRRTSELYILLKNSFASKNNEHSKINNNLTDSVLLKKIHQNIEKHSNGKKIQKKSKLMLFGTFRRPNTKSGNKHKIKIQNLIELYQSHYLEHQSLKKNRPTLIKQETNWIARLRKGQIFKKTKPSSSLSGNSFNSSSYHENEAKKSKLQNSNSIGTKMKTLSLAKKMRKFSREQKAAKTLGIVMGVFIICWLPFFIYNVITGIFKASLSNSHDIIYSIVTWFGYLNSGCNPIIYAFSSRDFRRAFYRILFPSRYSRNKKRLAKQTYSLSQQNYSISQMNQAHNQISANNETSLIVKKNESNNNDKKTDKICTMCRIYENVFLSKFELNSSKNETQIGSSSFFSNEVGDQISSERNEEKISELFEKKFEIIKHNLVKLDDSKFSPLKFSNSGPLTKTAVKSSISFSSYSQNNEANNTSPIFLKIPLLKTAAPPNSSSFSSSILVTSKKRHPHSSISSFTRNVRRRIQSIFILKSASSPSSSKSINRPKFTANNNNINESGLSVSASSLFSGNSKSYNLKKFDEAQISLSKKSLPLLVGNQRKKHASIPVGTIYRFKTIRHQDQTVICQFSANDKKACSYSLNHGVYERDLNFACSRTIETENDDDDDYFNRINSNIQKNKFNQNDFKIIHV